MSEAQNEDRKTDEKSLDDDLVDVLMSDEQYARFVFGVVFLNGFVGAA